jgi:ribosomal protein S6--L-glutamate ligase
MRLAVLCSPDSWYLGDLRRAAADHHEVVGQSFSEITSSWDGGQLRVRCGSCPLDRFDAVLVRSMPPGSLEQVVFRMDALARLDQAGVVVMNPPRSLETAIDKYLTTAKLAAAGLPSPKTFVCQTADEALAAFAELGGDVVVKPLFGGEGRGIFRLQNEDLASRAFHALSQLKAVLYIQEFIHHNGADVRLLVLGERVMGMRRVNSRDWRTNVSRGARTEPVRVSDAWAELARTAARAVGASLAGVDVLPAADGRLFVLEVNAVPGWKALARALDTDIAALVLDHLQRAAMER